LTDAITGPHVLVADDDPTIVLLLEHSLEGLGRTFDATENGAEAWQLWERTRHPLVVLDIEMPGMDGLEVCRRIREVESERKTYVLIVTGRDKAADLESVLDAGADDYITKPTSGQRLVARLRIAQRRMENDAARRQAEEELQKAHRLAGVGEAMVALQHEINNPLAGLLATAELMLLEAQEQKRPSEEIKTIIEQGRRISELVKRMGDLRDPQSVHYVGKKTMIDLGQKKG
jgi:DNA-binding response OmpR family regulator